MIVPRYYEDLCVLHDNTMMPRAYYVPASARTDDLVEHRENSDRLQMLASQPINIYVFCTFPLFFPL